MGVFEVAGNETFESLLTSSIPELKANHFATGCDVLAYEVDPDGRLTHPIRTFLVGSNSLRI
jgi:hypothetical protein